MKRLIFILCALICAAVASAQVYDYRFENRDAFKAYPQLMQPNERMVVYSMPSFNVDSLLEEDKKLDELGGYPFRFGYGFDVDYNLKDGKWLKDGNKRIWSMRFYSEGAYSLNFVFSEMTLSPKAELYIFSSDGSMVYGSVTADQNITNGMFSTIPIQGKDVVIQLIEPATAKEQSLLSISRVVHGYRNTFPAEDGEVGVTLLNCHNDVCNYSAWSTQSNAVARILLSNGTALCSGSLINNTSQDYAPYLLTAFHCIDIEEPYCSLSTSEKNAPASWTFQFLHKTCGNSVSYNQADFRAAWQNSDFALLRLRQATVDAMITFLGWDRGSSVSSTGTIIHHPEGTPMKISFDNNPLISNSSSMQWSNTCVSPVNTHWEAVLDNGTAESASSGGPLFNTDKRVIGQLHGGANICPPVTKFFGRFDISWTGGGTNDTRLSNWLNPTGSSATTLNSLVKISGLSLVPCTGTVTYSLPAVGSSSTVTWNVGALQIVSGQGTNTVTVQRSPSSTATSETIRATVTQSGATINVIPRIVDVGAPRVTSVNGPSSARVGNTASYTAEPVFPANQGNYQWIVSPNTVTTSPYRHTCTVTFNATGTYSVGVRSTSSCTSPGTYTTMTVSVSSSYAVSTDAGKQLSVQPSGLDNSAVVAALQGTIAYTLYNQSTGALVASGRIAAEGGTLDFGSIANGVYLLKLEVGDGIFDTHRIVLK